MLKEEKTNIPVPSPGDLRLREHTHSPRGAPQESAHTAKGQAKSPDTPFLPKSHSASKEVAFFKNQSFGFYLCSKENIPTVFSKRTRDVISLKKKIKKKESYIFYGPWPISPERFGLVALCCSSVFHSSSMSRSRLRTARFERALDRDVHSKNASQKQSNTGVIWAPCLYPICRVPGEVPL